MTLSAIPIAILYGHVANTWGQEKVLVLALFGIILSQASVMVICTSIVTLLSVIMDRFTYNL